MNLEYRNNIAAPLLIFCLIFLFFFSPSVCLAIDTWPASDGQTIASLSDASGAVWHPARQSLFAIQNSGTLVEFDSNGNLLDSWPVSGDLEGIALVEDDRYIYIGMEHPDSIVEFDLETNGGELSGKSWDLTSWMTGPDNSGLEGLAYRDGYFLAGLQADGKIYAFDVNLGVSGDVDFVETITPEASYSDISGLEYNGDTGILYAVFDTANALIEINSENEVENHYALPGNAQEGIAIVTSCLSQTASVYIADDSGSVVRYTGYPIVCLDADSDGTSRTTDCDDFDPEISENQTHFRDADGDGLGDAYSEIQACSYSSPEGYTTNPSDPADIEVSGRNFSINGTFHDLFGTDLLSVQYTDLNFFGDEWHEIVAVGLTGKRAYVTVAKVRGEEVSVAKRRMIRKKYRNASITTQVSKNKFTTRFNGTKKYVWKVKSSGTFNRSK